MAAYYNEFDPYAAQWLRNLVEAGHIAPGVVDERSIEDVHPADLRGFTQCHFFAGVGVWSLALRRAGWPDDRPVWTGSCPCQPFSAAGAGAGFEDSRHLWPTFAWLIKQCKPSVVFGEQVASKAVEPWVDLVHADLEAMGYAFGAVPFPSAGVGAPHIRDRLYWVAQSEHSGRKTGKQERSWSGSALSSGSDGGMAHGDVGGREQGSEGRKAVGYGPATQSNSCTGRLANTDGGHTGAEREQRSGKQRQQQEDSGGCELVGLGDTESMRRQGERLRTGSGMPAGGAAQAGDFLRPGPVNGFWRHADWLGCRDDKWRPVEPGTFPLAHGAASRVGRLRAYGNAINAEAATQFIAAYLDN